ncbi:hypothetical protein DPX16_1135 [Anabarilius grahami]|uniref:Uncharacterized protein n=1 Tax=Anabarilius grahami TaxID=495550 RepID=A0A3N0XZV2_ANAGA|nr:hypothetical protein DPX16_1135 [Anabarilius grahami]
MVNSDNLYCNSFKKGKVFEEQSTRGRSTSTFLEAVEINKAVPSIESDRTRLTYRSPPSNTQVTPECLSAPALGVSDATAVMRNKSDEMNINARSDLSNITHCAQTLTIVRVLEFFSQETSVRSRELKQKSLFDVEMRSKSDEMNINARRAIDVIPGARLGAINVTPGPFIRSVSAPIHSFSFTGATDVIPGAHICQSGRWRRKRTEISSEISSPEAEESSLNLPSSDQISLSFSRRISHEEMDEDCFLKMTDSATYYKDYSNKKKSLKWLTYKINDQNQDILNGKYSHHLNKENDIFNRFVNDLNEEAKKKIQSHNQVAFGFFRKKDGSFDMDRWRNKEKSVYYLENGKHTEDEIFEQQLKIYSEDDCDYSEIYIFSTNSPCLARKDSVPCMINAIFIAKMLYEKHGMKTIIGYLKPWGYNGSFENILSEISLKDCTSHFKSQTLESKSIVNNSLQTTTNKTEADMGLLIPVYKQIIPDVENKTFSMKGTKTERIKPKLDLAQYSSKIAKSDIKTIFFIKLNKIVSDLFKPDDTEMCLSDFEKHGLKKFMKCMEEMYDLLIEINEDASISREVCKYLENIFFPWWDEKVQRASSNFLKKETSCFLQKRAVCHFLRDIRDFEHFFVIGYVIKN